MVVEYSVEVGYAISSNYKQLELQCSSNNQITRPVIIYRTAKCMKSFRISEKHPEETEKVSEICLN